jgi:hypothetical protein
MRGLRLLGLVLALGASEARAEAETLLGPESRIGFYAAPQFRAGAFGGGAFAWAGGELAVLFDDFFGVGLSAQRGLSFTRVQPAVFSLGGVVRVTPMSSRVVHPSFAMTIAWGRFFRAPTASFLLIEPQVVAEVNIATWLRVHAGAAAQLTPGMSAVFNPYALLGVSVGRF